MNDNSLLMKPLSQDANQVIGAINQRSETIQKMLANISMSRKVYQKITAVLAIIAGSIALASVPTAIYHMSWKPLMYGAAALTTAAASAALRIFSDGRSATEALIKDQWQALFVSLESNNGSAIVEGCQKLLKRKAEHPKAFANAIGTLSIDFVEPFLHKTLFTGHLLNALEALDDGNTETANSYAHLALASFVLSALPIGAADCAHAIVNKPGRVTQHLNQCGCPRTISDLDAFVSVMASSLQDEHLHDFVRGNLPSS
jgi:hypothetical protein